MTKHVRIENADTSYHRVDIFLEEMNDAGEWVRIGGPTQLHSPAQIHTCMIEQHQRLVIVEAA